MKRLIKDNVNVRRKERPIFTPSYENDIGENFNFLMTNEYMKIWFKERDAFLKENRTPGEKASSETPIKRRYVQRVGHIKKETLPPIMHSSLKTLNGNKENIKLKTKTKGIRILPGQRFIPYCDLMH